MSGEEGIGEVSEDELKALERCAGKDRWEFVSCYVEELKTYEGEGWWKR